MATQRIMQATLLAIGLSACSLNAQSFSVTHLGNLTPGGPTTPYDINANGVVIGQPGFIWLGGTMIAMPNSPPLFGPSGSAINDNGVIAGIAATNGGFSVESFKYSSGTYTALGTLLPGFESLAYGINNQGDVVGDSRDPSGLFGPFAFLHRNGTMVGAGTLIRARDINDNGFVVGLASAPSGGGGAGPTMWDSNGGTQTYLGTLGGTNFASAATAINNHNQVVGHSNTAAGDTQAFIWSVSSGMTNLNAASLGAAESFAGDINNAGEVVGSMNFLTHRRALYWKNGAPVDLNTWLPTNSGWFLESANAINDSSCIVGTGTFNGVAGQAYMMCVPEPEIMSLVGFALGGLGLLRRRR